MVHFFLFQSLPFSIFFFSSSFCNVTTKKNQKNPNPALLAWTNIVQNIPKNKLLFLSITLFWKFKTQRHFFCFFSFHTKNILPSFFLLSSSSFLSTLSCSFCEPCQQLWSSHTRRIPHSTMQCSMRSPSNSQQAKNRFESLPFTFLHFLKRETSIFKSFLLISIIS